MKEYKHDVYLSFTGADRELKNDIAKRLEDSGFKNVYDSDAYCKGQFRQDYMEALITSKVFLMILSDNLRNDPAITHKGTLTEVRKELALACELEARNEINILILCTSEFFRFYNGYDNVGDSIGWLFYTHTRGFSYVAGAIEESGLLKDQAYHDIETRARSFIEKRDAGTPIISQAPKIEVAREDVSTKQMFVGREREIEEAIGAFKSGKQVVVLSGIGGMGKSHLAKEIVRICKEEHYFDCPQIVQVQEKGGNRNAMQTIVSSVTYTPEIYDNLSYLGEQDKYKRKLSAITNLPENILLVIDNYNALTDEGLRDVVSKLKCRLLITTRAAVSVDSSEIEYVSVDKIEEKDFLKLFSHLCGFEADENSFHRLYEKTGGHTITLCIFAKMIYVHKLSIEELISQMNDLDKMEEIVDENGKPDTILGHLQSLFSISDFNDRALHILRSMSILADGTISVSNLMRVLGLKNRNEINELVHTGWLEYSNNGEESLYLHPMLSQLMDKTLKPTEENVSETVDYLIGETKEQKEKMTYSSATVICERLYYASYILASNQGKLCQRLWDEYANINNLLGDSEGTRDKTGAIIERLSDSNEKALVSSYVDMLVLEQHPTRLDVLEKYLDNLSENANDYKWIMRSLSVTATHIIGVPHFAVSLDKIIEKAIDAAILVQDDFALSTLITYTFCVPSGKKLFSKIKAYIKANEKKKSGGDFLALKTVYSQINLTNAKSMDECMQKTKELMSLSDRQSVFFAIRHPIKFFRVSKLVDEMEKLEEADPLSRFFKNNIEIADRLVEEGAIDIAKFLDSVAVLYANQVERGVTLMSASQAFSNCLSFLGGLAVPRLSDGLNMMVDSIDMEDISIDELSRLQIATIVSVIVKDKKAVERSYLVYQAISRVRPKGHIDVIQAKRAYADNCFNLGDTRAALNIYLELYTELESNLECSSLLADVALKLLSYERLGNSISVKIAKGFFDKVEGAYKVTDYAYVNAMYHYVNVISRALGKGEIRIDDEEVSLLLDKINTMVSKSQRCDMYYQTELCWLIHSYAYCFIRDQKYSEAIGVASILKKVKASSKSSKHNRDGLCGEAINTIKAIQSKIQLEKISFYEKAMDALVKNNVFKAQARQKLIGIIAVINESISEFESLDKLFSVFTKDKAALEGMKTKSKELFATLQEEKAICKNVAEMLLKVFKSPNCPVDIDQEEYKKLPNAKGYMTLYVKRILETVKITPSTTQRVKLRRPNEMPRFDKIISRNGPCPCGSGKKYKDCCGKEG